jgi:amino acid adenylation domain-containing protein
MPTIQHQERSAINTVTDSIPRRFRRMVSLHPDLIAVSSGQRQWTYAELEARSNAVAARIASFRPTEPVVALLMDHDAPLIAAILGVLKAGGLFLALDPAEPVSALKAVLADSGADLLLVDAANVQLLRSGGSEIPILEISDMAVTLPGTNDETLPWPRTEPSAGSGAWLMYTSGSTGTPKGVWQNHAGVVHQAAVYSELVAISSTDRLSLVTSCNLAASATALFGALLNGATLCLFHLRSQGVERLAMWLNQEKITICHFVPTVFRHLLRVVRDDRCFESVRWLRLGGEPLLRSDVDRFKKQFSPEVQLLHAFSSTETGLICGLTVDADTDFSSPRVSVGKPVRGVELLLLDEDRNAVPTGVDGRIGVSGPGLAQGYWRKPQETASVFISLPDGRNMFITSDLGRVNSDGTLEHLGRVDNVVKVRGRRVDLSEVEAALLSVDCVKEAAATALVDETGECRLVACVVFNEGQKVETSELRKALRGQLSGHLVPSEIISLDALPQTTGGKIDRRALPVSSSNPRPSETAGFRLMPRDGIERKLARIWESVLGVSGIGRRDDFFDLGGTSIQSAQVISRIEQNFNVALPLSALSERSTIEELAFVLSATTVVSTASPLVSLRTGGTGRPLFLIHNGKGDISTYGQLARRLPERPVFALQSPGLDGRDWPLNRIEEMARRYRLEITRADPTGPYLIAGTCMGGMIAFEIARQLVEEQRQVALVALIDSRAPSRDRLEALRNNFRDVFRLLRWSTLRALGMTSNPRLLPSYRRFVANMNSRALRFYRPKFYPGTITVITTVETPQRKGERRMSIKDYAKETRFFTVSGRRTDLFVPPGVDELALRLQECFNAGRTTGV